MLVNFLAGVTSFFVAAGDDFSLSHTGSRQAASAFLGDVLNSLLPAPHRA